MSATRYAGLTYEPVEMSLQNLQEVSRCELSTWKMGRNKRCGYDYVEQMTSMIEAGHGLALDDVRKSQRLPNTHKQTGERLEHLGQFHSVLMTCYCTYASNISRGYATLAVWLTISQVQFRPSNLID